MSITEVMAAISGVLDGAIVAEPHIKPGAAAKTIDLSKIDFEVLMRKLDNLIRLNASRCAFLDRFQKMSEAIKKVCKDLLAKLKTEKLVLAWRRKRTTRAAVRIEIERMLDSGLPEKYTTELFEQDGTRCRMPLLAALGEF